MKKLAQFYEIKDGHIRCKLCPHRCFLADGEKGKCQVRVAERQDNGKLKFYTHNYGEVTSIALDSAGTKILSIGSFGCNLGCQYCHSHGAAHGKPKSQNYSPRDVVDILKKFSDSIGIAFTHNEPMIWYEYVYDTAVALKKVLPDKKVVLMTNGYINEEPLRKLLPYVDTLHIDLKGGESFYEEICSGTLEPVRRTIAIAHEEGCQVEVSSVLIEGYNTYKEQLLELGCYLRDIDPEIVLRLKRYFPHYQMELPATRLEVLNEAYDLLKVILPNVEIDSTEV
ncbi:MAG: radical SAM protein [Cellulosilyticaceae bacterium]